MSTQEILSIVALSLLGFCFLCGLAKMAMKKDSDKKNCDKACSMAIFAAVVLVGVSQLLTETEKYGDGRCCCDAQSMTCGDPVSGNKSCDEGCGHSYCEKSCGAASPGSIEYCGPEHCQ